jgi:hypothetical protein
MPLDTPNHDQDSERLTMEQLPANLQRSIVETLGFPVIPLFLGRKTEAEILWRHAGTGVLVEVDGESGILTAEHVIFSEDRLENSSLIDDPQGKFYRKYC